MSEDTLEYDTMAVAESGMVTGNAHTREFANGHTAMVGVTSYKTGNGYTNHVPSVVIVDEDGSIVNELHVTDSRDAETAIDRAREATAGVVESPPHYLD